jgi:hypothetical protein
MSGANIEPNPADFRDRVVRAPSSMHGAGKQGSLSWDVIMYFTIIGTVSSIETIAAGAPGWRSSTVVDGGSNEKGWRMFGCHPATCSAQSFIGTNAPASASANSRSSAFSKVT